MRKLRISTVSVVAGVLFIAVVFFARPLSHIRALGCLFTPAVLASIITSSGHAPGQAQTWISTVVQSGVQLALGILVFALAQEWRQFRAAAAHFEEAARHLAGEHPEDATAAFGRGMAEVNRRRTKTFFLEPIPLETPAQGQEDPDVFEGFVFQAVGSHEEHRAVKKAFRTIERRLTATMPKAEALRRVQAFRQLAKRGRSAGLAGAT